MVREGDRLRAQARDVVTALANNGFKNVTFFDGSIDDLRPVLRARNHACAGGIVFSREP